MTAALKLNQKGTERIGNGDYIHVLKRIYHFSVTGDVYFHARSLAGYEQMAVGLCL